MPVPRIDCQFKFNNNFNSTSKDLKSLKLQAVSHLRQRISVMTDKCLAEMMQIIHPDEIQGFIKDYVYLECDERFTSEDQVLEAQKFLNDLRDWDELCEEGMEDAQMQLIDDLDDWFVSYN